MVAVRCHMASQYGHKVNRLRIIESASDVCFGWTDLAARTLHLCSA